MNFLKHTFIVTALLIFFSGPSFAQETKFPIGPALGNDVAAYGKVFGIDPKPKESKHEWKGQKLPSDFFWFDEVPKLGKIKVRWTEKSPVVVYAAVRFPDKTVTSWQMAFARMGLSPDAKVIKEGANFVALTFPTENGKTCEAWYYKKDEEQDTKLPVIEFIIKEAQ